MNATQLAPELGSLSRELTAMDRCDSCGAKAWVRAVLGGSELLFCAHHAARHLDQLSVVATYIQDDRDLMLEDAAL